jgi:uncharacterized protein
MQYLIAAIIGLASGITSGLFGVGGGIIMVPAMMFLLNVPIKEAIGTSLLVIIPTALAGTFKHHLQGHVDWRIALTLAPLAILGSYFGAWLTTFLPAEVLRRLFGGFLLLVGLRLLFMK